MIPGNIKNSFFEKDSDFFTHMYHCYYHLIRRIAREFTPNDAEDIVQETFLRLFPHIDQLQRMEDKARAAYVAITAKCAGIVWIRRARPETVIYSDDMSQYDFVAGEEYDPAALLDKKASAEQLAQLMELLPERDRMLLLLKYFLLKEDRDIAPIFNVKVDSVRKMIERARKKLLEIIKQDRDSHK